MDKVLAIPALAGLTEKYGSQVVTYAVRATIDNARSAALDGESVPDADTLADRAATRVKSICCASLSPVINATGVVLHTNLGRAPLGQTVIDEIAWLAGRYTNLEFDLTTGSRGDRNLHSRELLRYLTGAEDTIVVNNNAAGVVLALNTMAEGREAIISRGELIEIGGAFRLPEIMAASGAKMVEVGTTNRTRLADYETAITEDTALILKAHKSNYSVCGFTEEVSAADLAKLAHAHDIPLLYDIGSGLLQKPNGLQLDDEPDVRTSLADGADVVAFSCDKLLGGPQAGILAGRAEFINRIAHAPMMRAFRVGKLTFAALGAVCRQFLTDSSLREHNPTFGMLELTPKQLRKRARSLFNALDRKGISSSVVESQGQCGGGTLPDLRKDSFAVEILDENGKGDGKHTFSELLYKRLLEIDPPVLGVLREGRLVLDMLTVGETEVDVVVKAVVEAVERVRSREAK